MFYFSVTAKWNMYSQEPKKETIFSYFPSLLTTICLNLTAFSLYSYDMQSSTNLAHNSVTKLMMMITLKTAVGIFLDSFVDCGFSGLALWPHFSF